MRSIDLLGAMGFRKLGLFFFLTAGRRRRKTNNEVAINHVKKDGWHFRGQEEHGDFEVSKRAWDSEWARVWGAYAQHWLFSSAEGLCAWGVVEA